MTRISRPARIAFAACSALALVVSATAPALAVRSPRSETSLTASIPKPPARIADNPNPYCSWWTITTPSTMNVAFPDSNAAYWTTPYIAKPGESIVVNGAYPEARYMSFTVYDNTFGVFTNNGVLSQISDYQIQPEAGSSNPWAANASADTPVGGAFSVTLRPVVSTKMKNSLPILPSNPVASGNAPARLGFLVYRVYLPANMDFSSVPLPTLSVVNARGDVSPLPRCQTKERPQLATLKQGVKLLSALKGLAKTGPAAPVPPCGDTCTYNAFLRPTAASTSRVFPNPGNAYAAMIYQPTAGQLMVVRMLVPSTPLGEKPVAWPNASYDLRYWSMCNNVYEKPYPVVSNPSPNGTPNYGCISDDTAVVDSQGYATFVLSRPSDRPKNATAANGINWLPMSVTKPRATGLLALRHMLPSANFTESVLAVPYGSNPAATAAVMGAYYPQTYTCSAATFRVGGVAACMAG